jgi:hypothetical protein
MIVERFQLARLRIQQDFVEPAVFRLSREEADPERLSLLQGHVHVVEHGNAARHMEPANADRKPLFSERPRQIQGAGKLVGLHADHGDERLAAGALDLAHDGRRAHAPIGLVERFDPDLDAVAQDLARRAILGNAVQACERVGRDRRKQPLDRVAVIVVMRRLDHDEMKDAAALRLNRHPCPTSSD